MKRFIISISLAFCFLGTIGSKENISITTDNTQLVYQIGENNRLYQTYLGQRLQGNTNLDMLRMPRVTGSNSNEAYPVLGTEDYYDQALEIRHADGNPTSILKCVSHSTKPVEGGTETVFILKDDLYLYSTPHF